MKKDEDQITYMDFTSGDVPISLLKKMDVVIRRGGSCYQGINIHSSHFLLK